MKHLLLILSFITVALFGLEVAVDPVPSLREIGAIVQPSVDCLHADDNIDECVNSPIHDSFGNMLLVGSRPFVRHFSGSSNRSCRTVTHYYIPYLKNVMRLMSLRMKLLGQDASQYSSIPYLGCSIPSDHYVFGMRRILI